MSVWRESEYLSELEVSSDWIDIEFVIGNAGLEDVVARSLSYIPFWLRLLYLVRVPIALLMGLRTAAVPGKKRIVPDELPVEPGESIGVLEVEHVEPGTIWAGVIRDRHLDARLVMVRDDLGSGISRFSLGTFVEFHGRPGRIYLFLIKPFHHLVVRAILNHALRKA